MPTLHWIGKDKVINHHLDVPFRVLEQQYTYSSGLGLVGLTDEQDFEEKNKKSQLGFTGLMDEQDFVEKSEIQKSLNPKNPNADNNSGNKIIHGDNLEALKALLPEYESKIKCIYIDPPYNTGNEGWVYNDNVSDPKFKKWLGQIVGKEAEDLTRHDKWLCMMYPRLKLLHKLLADDGAIFISIDDNEQANLKLICDEIFGSGNFLAPLIWKSRKSVDARTKTGISNDHEYILVYKKRDLQQFKGVEKDLEKFSNPDNDERGAWRSADLTGLATKEQRPNLHYDLIDPNTEITYACPDKGWRYDRKSMDRKILEKRILFPKNGTGRPRNKIFMEEMASQSKAVSSVILDFTTSDGTRELKNVFNTDDFSFPKPPNLVEFLIDQICNEDDLILDSYAGSGTTAHAVLNLNKADGGNRKFILIEMEDYAESITAERVKRVINGYGDKEGTGGSFDFYELGPALFLEDGNLNEAVGIERIREYIWYSETKKPMSEFGLSGLTDKQEIEEQNEIQKSPNQTNPNTFLGIENDTAFYFYYAPDEVTSLDHEFLASIKTKAEQYVIYADNCLLTKEFMAKYHIIFKKIPRDISKF